MATARLLSCAKQDLVTNHGALQLRLQLVASMSLVLGATSRAPGRGWHPWPKRASSIAICLVDGRVDRSKPLRCACKPPSRSAADKAVQQTDRNQTLHRNGAFWRRRCRRQERAGAILRVVRPRPIVTSSRVRNAQAPSARGTVATAARATLVGTSTQLRRGGGHELPRQCSASGCCAPAACLLGRRAFARRTTTVMHTVGSGRRLSIQRQELLKRDRSSGIAVSATGHKARPRERERLSPEGQRERERATRSSKALAAL
jgi:hypothetical protein